MDRLILYIPSYNDSQLVAQSLATVPDWDVVISDNASDPQHRAALAALAGPRVRVIHQPAPLGRVGNWQFCVEHFAASDGGWMKFLLAGDRHKPDSLAACRRAIAARGEAQLIITNVENVWPHERKPWATVTTSMELAPANAMLEIVQRGNVFHGLLAALVRREAVSGGFAFGAEALEYCADLVFLMTIAAGGPVFFHPEIVSEFVVEHRKTFQTGQYTLGHFLEEGLVRLRAADRYEKLTGNRPTRNQLIEFIAHWLREGLNQSPQTR